MDRVLVVGTTEIDRLESAIRLHGWASAKRDMLASALGRSDSTILRQGRSDPTHSIRKAPFTLRVKEAATQISVARKVRPDVLAAGRSLWDSGAMQERLLK